MLYRSRMSSKGQVTIPSEVRERLHLEPGDTVIYEVEDERAVLRRAEPFGIAYHAAVSGTVHEWTSQAVSLKGDSRSTWQPGIDA